MNFISPDTFLENCRKFKDELRAAGRTVLPMSDANFSYSPRRGLKLNNEQVMMLDGPEQYYISLHGLAPARNSKMINALLHAIAFIENPASSKHEKVIAARMQHIEGGHMFDAFPIKSVFVVGTDPNNVMFDLLYKHNGDNGKYPVSWLPISRAGATAKYREILNSRFTPK